MKEKVSDIVNKILEIRAFNSDSYLKTTHFTAFLLFGCSEEMRSSLERRAWEIIVDRRGVAFLMVDDVGNIVTQMRELVDQASKSGVDLADLYELHLCPVIISDKAVPADYSQVVDALEEYKRLNDYVIFWKPFIILNTEEASADEWLIAIATKTKSLSEAGSSDGCRCCIMTRRDEKNFAVADERLFDTILFTALLHANKHTRSNIGRRIAYHKGDAPEDLFYTAQSVFISNPVIMRTFARLLEVKSILLFLQAS